MEMTDEAIKELWNTKDNIAKEHGYSINALAEYYLQKQATRHGLFRHKNSGAKAEQSIQPGRSEYRERDDGKPTKR